MSHQPMIEIRLDNGMHYLFVAKPGDHKYLIEWLEAYDSLPSKEYVYDKIFILVKIRRERSLIPIGLTIHYLENKTKETYIPA